ncbi:MAG TPA: hypothetical protein VFS21_13935 [Roseiflexaceae bacterium]|nr:hypothetical protein [Roseiflexaceae bacterium]
MTAPNDPQAERLLQALRQQSELSCEQAEQQILALAEAELAGVDVDERPEFAAILRHLDSCVACAERYAELAEELAASAGAQEGLAEKMPAVQPFFVPARRSDQVLLRVLGGQLRRFELELYPPPLPKGRASFATLSGETLFADTLPEVVGDPVVSVALNGTGERRELLVVIRDAHASTRWRVSATAGSETRSATTDDQGVARLGAVPVADLDKLALIFAEERA